MKRIIVALSILFSVATMALAQSKPDSTNFKNLITKLQRLQLQKAKTDSVSLKLQGAIELTYSEAIEESKRLQSVQPAAKGK